MNNKELILKRLLEANHITLEELFILNEKENNTVIINDLNPSKITHIGYPDWTWRPEYAPHYTNTPYCTSTNLNSKNES